MRKKFIFAAALCLTTLSLTDNINAAVQITQEVQQDGRTIRGTVIDNTGEPVIGANVTIKGTTNGVITDIDGNFILNNAKGTLVVSFVGYKTQEIPITNKTTINVTLQEDSELLDEVVVVGYGTQKKASLTSAITQIKGEEAFANKGISNATVALQGEVPGLVITRTSSRPGSENAAMKIRGDISINGNSSPLIIIDGMSGSLDELNAMNPNDIENISVLKDASAAIYGARSAAGVVLVTTKRGKKGKAQIAYSGSISRTTNGIQPPLTDNRQWLDMFFEAQYWDANYGTPGMLDPRQTYQNVNYWILGGGKATAWNPETGKWEDDPTIIDPNTGAIMSYGGSNLFDALRAGKVVTIADGSKIKRWDPNVYMEDYLYGQATSHKHTVTISGADDKFNYYASLGFSDSQSQLKVADDGEKKYSARLNADYQANELLKFSTSMAYEKRDISTPSTDVGTGWMDPWLWPILNMNGDPYDTFSGSRNPIGGLLYGGRIDNSLTTFRGDMKITLDLSKWVKGLSLVASGNYKLAQRNKTEVKNEVTYYDWIGTVNGSKNGPGSLNESVEKWENVTLGGFANYERTFANIHSISAMIGMTAEQETSKKVVAARNMGPMYPGSGLTDLNVWITGDNNTAEGGQGSWGFVSYMGRLNYIYDDKYSVEVLGRRDGSSKLDKSQRWQNFYSVSGFWRLSRENFLKDIPWLSDLKVRYNYGKTGSVEGISNYERFSEIKTGTALFGITPTQHTSLWVDGMRSADRTWETLNSHNIGMDVAVLNNRLRATMEYFIKTNDGMFITTSYPAVLGAGAPKLNDGKLRANGWEIALNWNDQIGQVKYNIGGSLSDAWTKLLTLPNNEEIPQPGYNSKRLVGKPLNAIYVYQTDGLFQTQEEVDAFYEMFYWNADHTGPKAGNILPAPSETNLERLRPGARRYVDLDGDGAITNKDIYYAGETSPRLTFGFKAGLEWKGIDVSAFFQGVGKQVILRGGSVYAPFVVNYVRQNYTFMGKTWAPDHTNAEYPILSRNQNFNKFNYNNIDASVQKNRYIRLKSLVVGYSLPKQWIAKAGLNKLRVYFSGDDLWEWTKIKDGYDPENGEGGNTTFPFSRLLTFGIDVTF